MVRDLEAAGRGTRVSPWSDLANLLSKVAIMAIGCAPAPQLASPYVCDLGVRSSHSVQWCETNSILTVLQQALGCDALQSLKLSSGVSHRQSSDRQ